MSTFKTKNGIELPLIEVNRKPYLQVAHRIVWFREEHPDWLIRTSFVRLDDQVCIAKAEILDSEGKVRAVAHKREDIKHFADHMEKAETSAIGRALAILGYGTQFCLEDFDEGDRIADSPVGPAKKDNRNASSSGRRNTDNNGGKAPQKAEVARIIEDPSKSALNLRRAEIKTLAESRGWTLDQVQHFMVAAFNGADVISKLNDDQLKELKRTIQTLTHKEAIDSLKTFENFVEGDSL